ncbi:MAG: SgcJ/EcaC family oxidoreductase [Hyphomonadaceae bacterium]
MKPAALAALIALVFTVLSPNASAQSADEAAVTAVLTQYQASIERLDANGAPEIFAPDAQIIEQGHVEGTYQNYLANHLGPELAEFASFDFDNYTVSIRILGDVALAAETYTYRIALKDGRTVDRQGAATSVLERQAGGWRIMQHHSSSRAPRAP